jgi:hypothetical protein
MGSQTEGERKKLGVMEEFDAGHSEIARSLKVICHASIVPTSELVYPKAKAAEEFSAGHWS